MVSAASSESEGSDLARTRSSSGHAILRPMASYFTAAGAESFQSTCAPLSAEDAASTDVLVRMRISASARLCCCRCCRSSSSRTASSSLSRVDPRSFLMRKMALRKASTSCQLPASADDVSCPRPLSVSGPASLRVARLQPSLPTFAAARSPARPDAPVLPF